MTTPPLDLLCSVAEYEAATPLQRRMHDELWLARWRRRRKIIFDADQEGVTDACILLSRLLQMGVTCEEIVASLCDPPSLIWSRRGKL